MLLEEIDKVAPARIFVISLTRMGGIAPGTHWIEDWV
jgi:hypothetical protein